MFFTAGGGVLETPRQHLPFAPIHSIYIIIMNIIGFYLMGLDKHRARTRQWRIPEKVLFGAALLGGSAGAWAGMYAFRHKTRRWYFVAGMPLILAVQTGLLWYFLR